MRRTILAVTAITACGAPDVGPDSATTRTEYIAKLIPHASITGGGYQACNAAGHVLLKYEAASDAFRFYPDPPRASKVDALSINSRAWSAGESSWTGDMSQSLTVDGRLRDERPALWAKSAARVPALWLDTTGLDRKQLERVIERLDDSTADADARRHHQLGALHLHLPAAAVFEQAWISGPHESYSARFVRKTQWVQSRPIQDFAGAKFWWISFQQGTNDHTGLPTIPAWHGEAAIGAMILEIDASHSNATEARFLEFARFAIEAALVDPTAPCRQRSGHMGT
jgi:hypothetical protein